MSRAEMTGKEKISTLVTIQKVVNLIKSKHSSERTDLHVKALKKVVQNSKTGFLLRELYDLSQLLSICSECLHRSPEYTEPLCNLVENCGRPFLKEKTSDENTYAPQVIEILSWLGQLAKGNISQLTGAVAQTIAAFYSEQPNHALTQGLQMTKLTFNAALVERSGVAANLVQALEKCREHGVCLDLLRTLQLLSTTSTNCSHMLSVGAAQIVCDMLPSCDRDHQVIFSGVEILCNLLDKGPQLKVAAQLSSVRCIAALKVVANDLMMSSDKGLQYRQLRNDLIMICSQIARLCPDAPFVETGFLKELCFFAFYEEENNIRTHTSTISIQFTTDHEDFELKKTLICLLTTVSSEKAAVRVLSNEKIVRSLLSFVIPNEMSQENGFRWNPAQFEELQLLTLSCLSTIAPLCTEDYMLCQGNTRLLLLVEWCTKEQGKFRGHGNSFHGEGGRGNRVAQLRYSLHLLLSMCSGGDEAVNQDLHEQGAIPLLIGVLKRLFDSSFVTEASPSDSPILLEIQSDILLIASCVCELDTHRKELFGGYDGVKIVVDYLKRDINKFGSGLGHHRLLLAATDCIWCTVVGNPIVEDIFLEMEGVFVLLDILQECPANMQNLVLGVLVDLCENPKAIPHVATWRGSGDKLVWSLLSELWRKEERDMEVPREYMDTLAGTFQPLMGAEQCSYGVPPVPTHCPSASITDVTENMRAKIYALCCKMGFQFPPSELSTEDKITMCIVESYLDFKSGEVWYEVAGELTQEGLRPVTPDQEFLTNILQTHEEKAEETLRIQHELINKQVKKDEFEEREFYYKIKEFHKIGEKAENDFQNFVQRTSNYKTLKEAKQRQVNAMDASRRSNVAIGNRFHSLDQHELNVTTFCGRRVSIATTPIKLLSDNIVSNLPHQHTQNKTLAIVRELA